MPRARAEDSTTVYDVFMVEDLVQVMSPSDTGGNAHYRGVDLVYRIMSLSSGRGPLRTAVLEDVEDGWRSNNIELKDLELVNRRVWADRLEEKMLPVLNERVTLGVKRIEGLKMQIAILKEYKSSEDTAEEILKKYGVAGLKAAGFSIVKTHQSNLPQAREEVRHGATPEDAVEMSTDNDRQRARGRLRDIALTWPMPPLGAVETEMAGEGTEQAVDEAPAER